MPSTFARCNTVDHRPLGRRQSCAKLRVDSMRSLMREFIRSFNCGSLNWTVVCWVNGCVALVDMSYLWCASYFGWVLHQQLGIFLFAQNARIDILNKTEEFSLTVKGIFIFKRIRQFLWINPKPPSKSTSLIRIRCLAIQLCAAQHIIGVARTLNRSSQLICPIHINARIS